MIENFIRMFCQNLLIYIAGMEECKQRRYKPSQSLAFGLSHVIRESSDASLLTEQWIHGNNSERQILGDT